MVSYKILDVKKFTSDLLMDSLFEDLYLMSAEINTYNSFILDGRLRRNYYSEEELEKENIEEYSRWKSLRPICFNLIKEKRLPLSIKFVFKLPDEERLEFMKLYNIENSGISELYINIRYEDKNMNCITACSFNSFVLDKSIEKLWDSHVKEYLAKRDIVLIEVS